MELRQSHRASRGASIGELLVVLIVLGIVGGVVALALQQCGSAVGQYGQGLSQSRDRGAETAIALTMRQVHLALQGATLADPRMRLPEEPGAMMEWLIEQGYVRRSDLASWPSRTPGEPVFFVVASTYQGSMDGSRVAMYEHPDNHAGAGGTVVYGDGSVRFLEGSAFDDAIASARGGNR